MYAQLLSDNNNQNKKKINIFILDFNKMIKLYLVESRIRLLLQSNKEIKCRRREKAIIYLISDTKERRNQLDAVNFEIFKSLTLGKSLRRRFFPYVF